MVELPHYRILRVTSLVILIFFSWTFGGLSDIAYAVNYSGKQSAAVSSQQ
jgi:hypothetical protein